MKEVAGYALTWHHLRSALEEAIERGADPIVLSTLPFRTDLHHDHSAFPFILVPPGRLIAIGIGIRAVLPDKMIILVGAAESVTLGTNHLIHAARRNMGLTMLLLRSDLLPSHDDALDRTGWVETGHGEGAAPAGTPLDWAAALHASLVARARIDDPTALADLMLHAEERAGFAVVGVTGDPTLPLGISSTNDWPEYFAAYREWAAPLLRDDAGIAEVTSVVPAPDAPDRVEVRIAGIGGHGVKLAGTILSEAAGLGSGLWATHYGEYGSATRGGPSRVDVVYGAQRISYAGADHPDVLIALSAAAVNSYGLNAGAATKVVVDSDLEVDLPDSVLRVPLIRLAREHTGKPIGAGVTSLGSVVALTEGIGLERIIAAVDDKLPWRIAEKNIAALTAAYEETTVQIGASV
jgi:2-oxoglutarate ferredoxin oxidoreductase subunit gamma